MTAKIIGRYKCIRIRCENGFADFEALEPVADHHKKIWIPPGCTRGVTLGCEGIMKMLYGPSSSFFTFVRDTK